MAAAAEKKAAAHMSARERAQQALQASSSLTRGLSDMREGNDRKLSETDPRAYKRHHDKAKYTKYTRQGQGRGQGKGQGQGQGNRTKRQAAQQRNFEKQKKKADARALRLHGVGDVHHKPHQHRDQHLKGPAPLTAAEHRALGRLPQTRKRAMGAAHQKKGDHHDGDGGGGGDDDANDARGGHSADPNAHLNKHKHEYDNAKKKDKHAAVSASLSTNENSPWIAFVDDHTAYTVYYNEATKDCSWSPPPAHVGYRWLDVANGEEPPPEARAKIDVMSDPEGLGAEWMSSTYREPSIARALEFRRRSIFRGGDSRLSLPLHYVGEMGVGTLLYFRFLLHLIRTFLVMSILVSPILFSSQADTSNLAVAELESIVYRLTGRASTSIDDCLRADVSVFFVSAYFFFLFLLLSHVWWFACGPLPHFISRFPSFFPLHLNPPDHQHAILPHRRFRPCALESSTPPSSLSWVGQRYWICIRSLS
jgi:hypothetical protein